MHDGCALTLADRFANKTVADKACSGGDKHGVTSKLTPDQVGDLVTFLNTL